MQNIASRISSIFKIIAKPVLAQMPFFVFTFLMWTPCCFLEVRDAFIESAWRPATNIAIMCYLGLAIFYSYCFTTIIHLAKHKAVKISGYIISLIIFYLYWAIRKLFSTDITPQIMLLAAETNNDEASEFVRNYISARGNISALIITFFMLASIILAEWLYPKVKICLLRKNYLNYIISVLIIVSPLSLYSLISLFSCRNMKDIEEHFTYYGTKGIDTMSQILYSTYCLNLNSNEASNFISITKNEAKNGDAQVLNPSDSLNIVIIIGESYNKRHASIYGYPLATTPHMIAEQQKGNLTVFTNVISPYNTTSRVLKKVLSTAISQHGQQWQEFPLTVATFHKAGYDVLWWDNQLGRKGKRSIFDFSLNSILFHPKLEFCYTMRNHVSLPYDGDLIDDYLNSTKSLTRKARRLVVFHLLGQHIMARERYPVLDSQWVRYTPDSVINKAPYIDQQARIDIAHYDNATLYNDEIVGRIIDLFRNENTILIYFSDHGEEVYDYRYSIGRNHSGNKSSSFLKSQNDIPFMVWCSNKYINSHPKVISRLRNAADIPFMNTDLSQILFDLGDITSSYRDDTCNPLSPAFKPYHRIVYDNIDYDKVTKQ